MTGFLDTAPPQAKTQAENVQQIAHLTRSGDCEIRTYRVQESAREITAFLRLLPFPAVARASSPGRSGRKPSSVWRQGNVLIFCGFNGPNQNY